MNFPMVDPASPENLEREKRYAEIKARGEKNDAERNIMAAEYFRNNPDAIANNQGTGNGYNRNNFSMWHKPNDQWDRNHNYGFKNANSTPMEQIIWLIDNWIPEGELTLLIGPPNSGKNTIVLAIAAAFSRGDGRSLWHGVKLNRKGNSMLSSTEEKFASTSMLKFFAAEGDKKSLINFSEITEPWATSARRCNFSDEDYDIVKNEIKKNGNISLMILDPVSQVVRGSLGNKAKDREGYETLAQFAENLKLSALGIGHPPKTTKGKSLYARMDGSSEAGKVARSIIMVDKIKGSPLPDGATHVMVLAKSFGAPVNYGVTYSIVGCRIIEDGIEYDTAKIVWHGIIPGTAEEILALAESGEMVTGKVDPVDVAVSRLNEALKDGPRHGKEVEKLVRTAGTTVSELNEAKKILDIKSNKQEGAGKSSPWLWRLPSNDAK